MKKYMIVYQDLAEVSSESQKIRTCETDEEMDRIVYEIECECHTNPEVYIYTIYGYQLLYR